MSLAQWFQGVTRRFQRSRRRPRRVPRAARALTLSLQGLEERVALSFLPPITLDVARAPTAAATADFNGDSLADLAVANSRAYTVSVFVQGAARADYPVNDFPFSVAAGDVNGDRAPDLVVGTLVFDTVHVLLNNGNGSFRDGGNYATGNDPVDVVLADFNSDGRLDAVTVNVRSNTISFLYGDGTGAFQAPVHVSVGAAPFSAAAGHLNGDAVPDLAVTNGGDSTVTVLLTGGAAATYRAGLGVDAVAIADYDRNGWPDLLTANPLANTMIVLFNRGGGSYRAPSVKANFPTGAVPISVAVGDFNRDGRPDAVTANEGPDTVTVFLNGRGRFDYSVGGADPQHVVVADFNADGWPDLATVNYSTINVSVLLNAADWGDSPKVPGRGGSRAAGPEVITPLLGLTPEAGPTPVPAVPAGSPGLAHLGRAAWERLPMAPVGASGRLAPAEPPQPGPRFTRTAADLTRALTAWVLQDAFDV